MMEFEWNEDKNIINVKKHGLNFEDAKPLFTNNTLLIVEDDRKNYNESRYTGLGSIMGRVVNVVFTIRQIDTIRIISFRKANNREKTKYKNRT